MNQLAENRNNPTMSSKEIAELVESRHDSVKRAIERLADRGVIELPPLVEIPTATKPISQYQIGKRDSYVIVAQLSPEFTARLVDRWQELESAQAPALALPDFSNPAEAARAWAEQYELREAANQALSLAAPKAAFVDQYVDNTGSMGFRQVAKLLQANERHFRQMLLDKGVMYYLGGSLTPYSQHQDAGRFEVKTGTCEANGHAFSQARFTPKGVQWIAGLWAEHRMQEAA